MANDNYNRILPVESLQNIAGLTPIQRNKDKEHKQEQQKKKRRNERDELIPSPQNNPQIPSDKSGDDDHSIDYCA